MEYVILAGIVVIILTIVLDRLVFGSTKQLMSGYRGLG